MLCPKCKKSVMKEDICIEGLFNKKKICRSSCNICKYKTTKEIPLSQGEDKLGSNLKTTKIEADILNI